MSISTYKTMWAIVTFDLPTITKEDKRNYVRFRKELLKNGFFMLQFSVYIRPFGSPKHMDSVMNKIESIMPPIGKVSLIPITDRQFGMIKNFYNALPDNNLPQFEQLSMF